MNEKSPPRANGPSHLRSNLVRTEKRNTHKLKWPARGFFAARFHLPGSWRTSDSDCRVVLPNAWGGVWGQRQGWGRGWSCRFRRGGSGALVLDN